MLKGKTVVIAVSGSIAAYKMPNVCRMLKKLGADVPFFFYGKSASLQDLYGSVIATHSVYDDGHSVYLPFGFISSKYPKYRR